MEENKKSDYVFTNIRISKKQRDKLQYFQKLYNKSMSQLIQEAVDEKYHDPVPPERLLQKEIKPDIVKEDYAEDISSIASGLSQDVYDRIFKR